MNPFDALYVEARQSRLWLTALWVAEMYRSAWPQSATRTCVERLLPHVSADATSRVRAAAAAIGLAALGYTVISQTLLPEYVATRLAWWWAGFAVLALVVAVNARAYVAAWPRSAIALSLSRWSTASRPEAK